VIRKLSPIKGIKIMASEFWSSDQGWKEVLGEGLWSASHSNNVARTLPKHHRGCPGEQCILLVLKTRAPKGWPAESSAFFNVH